MKFKDLKTGEYYATENLTCNEKGSTIRIYRVDIENCYFFYVDGRDRSFMYYVSDVCENVPLSQNGTDINSEKKEIKELVNHPSHYNKGKYEVIDVIEDWGLGFSLGNAIKYIARCEHKGNKKQDLEKAIFYLKRELERENSDEK